MKYSIVRRLFNRVLHLLARFLPGAMSVRPFLHRLRGVRIHGTVFIGDDVYLENDHPECVEIHDEAIVGLRAVIVAHTRGQGQIVIGKKACLGAGCIIVCPVGKRIEIGEGAVVGAGAVVSRSVPPRTLCTGPKAMEIATVTVPLTCDVSYDAFIAGLLPLGTAPAKPLRPQ
jgi:acetyltransferase-like isoleucine patch superfamily enzyme